MNSMIIITVLMCCSRISKFSTACVRVSGKNNHVEMPVNPVEMKFAVHTAATGSCSAYPLKWTGLYGGNVGNSEGLDIDDDLDEVEADTPFEEVIKE